MTETQRDECLIQLVKSVNKLDNRMDNIENKMDNFESKMDNIENKIDNFESRMDNIENKMDNFENKMDNFENRMDNFENKLNENIAFTQRISESVAVMEVEHGSKLNALFDGYKANSEKLDKIETDIHNIHTILENHENRLYLIESR